MQKLKKTLVIVLAVLLLCGAGFIYFKYYFVFGSGIKTGTLNYVVHKGYRFKTYEGEMILSGVSSKEKAMEIISENLALIDEVSDGVLRENGFYYGAQSRLCEEDFPTRTYGELTLESGIYDALIVDLGSGEGDNWWCVVFPPLCFVADGEGEKVTYKSLIVEWFKKLFG